jgi:RNA methyltransferase, TrmH family
MRQMITKAQIQYIRSLEQKKVRDESNCFIIEGDKLVREALTLPSGSSYLVIGVYGTSQWMQKNWQLIHHLGKDSITISSGDLDRISLQKTPNQVLAIIQFDRTRIPSFDFQTELLIGLCQVQDPGNIGTIIRLADWFGISGVIASKDSADFFSPKVVQASMGSIFRIKLLTIDLGAFVRSLPKDFPIYGTHLMGENIYTTSISKNGIILLGNESKGLSTELINLTTKNLLIPNFSKGSNKPESLNVSIAAAIISSEFRRQENDQH